MSDACVKISQRILRDPTKEDVDSFLNSLLDRFYNSTPAPWPEDGTLVTFDLPKFYEIKRSEYDAAKVGKE